MLLRLLYMVFLIMYLCFSQVLFADHPESLNFLVLGDSYSVGTGINPDEAWPQQLVKALERNDVQLGDIRVIAQNGWTTDKLLEALQSADLSSKYDVVFILIGVNDIVRWRADTDYSKRLLTILGEAVNYNRHQDFSKLIVFSLPDYGVTPVGQRFWGGQVCQILLMAIIDKLSWPVNRKGA